MEMEWASKAEAIEDQATREYALLHDSQVRNLWLNQLAINRELTRELSLLSLRVNRLESKIVRIVSLTMGAGVAAQVAIQYLFVVQ